ncbi:hypothetical protein, conserved [Leishmania tarentolae]|uniref:Uncharacterized protein n=1 Tax=Leishmania tarentolae TaxID=5689 RepID=A0A640KF19_LEITA|nr:hypothetical protein, conserved [Leishmania tarentolae]
MWLWCFHAIGERAKANPTRSLLSSLSNPTPSPRPRLSHCALVHPHSPPLTWPLPHSPTLHPCLCKGYVIFSPCCGPPPPALFQARSLLSLNMDTSSTRLTTSATASGLVSSPFVPCTEDSAHTRRVGRHPILFQRTLDAVSYRYLTASSRLARTVASASSDNNAASVALHAAATAEAAHTAYVMVLTENYQQLWQQRGLVPKAARREWFETVVVHLKALNVLGATLAWLTDTPTASVETADVGVDYGMIATGGTVPNNCVAPAALPHHADGERKQKTSREPAHEPLPLWCLWQDAQRHLHHMTLRLFPWTPVAGRAYGTREAMRMSDLTRMDSSAFAWRVRQWCCTAALFHSPRSTDAEEEASLVGVTEGVHRGMIADVVWRVHPGGNSSTSAASPSPSSFSAEEPEVARMLLLCLGTTAETAAENCLARQYVAGALVYRMLLEVTLGRLRALPRCIFTWRLLRDVIREHVMTLAAGFLNRDEQKVALLAMTAYLEEVVIPYLQHRDCHLESLRHTAAQVHAQFAHLASAKLEDLRAAVASIGGGNSDKAGAVEQSGAEATDVGVDGLSAATEPAAETSAEDKEAQSRLPEAQRQSMATSMELLLRHACTSVSTTFTETKALQCAKDIVASTILGSTAVVGRVESAKASDRQYGDASAVPSESWEDELLSMRRDLHGKKVDDGVLHSPAARLSQLRFFLYHYFTQSPTLAFDRVCNTAAAPALAEVGNGGEVS